MGAQTALAWRYEQLLEFTKSQEGTLDRIASFAPFVVDEYLLLPSITETRDRFDLSADQKEIRTMRVQYIMDQPPRAVTQPPTWRDYLWREYPYPEPPHPALLPKNPEEEAVWEAAVEEGWQSGLEQAQLSWENNLNRLVRDIRGRVTYRVLESRKIVQRPVMVGSTPTITVSADGRTLNAGDQVYSITVPMEFTPDTNWKPLWRQVDTNGPRFQLLDRGRPVGEPSFKVLSSHQGE
jgi:defect-in-organelle-trafficking protein DotC